MFLLFINQQFQRRSDIALRVGLPFSSFIGPLTPLIRAQNDLRRFAALLPGLSLDGGVVTAVLSLDPGFFRRYAMTPFLVRPAPDSVDLL
jgi:hypothetical protein